MNNPESIVGAGLALGVLASLKLCAVTYNYLFKKRVPIERLTYAETDSESWRKSYHRARAERRALERRAEDSKKQLDAKHKQLVALGANYNVLKKREEQSRSRIGDLTLRIHQLEADVRTTRGYARKGVKSL